MSIYFSKNISLLYAEDEKMAQTLYSSYFKQYFNTVYVADNGQQALDCYKENQPDVIVLDINMPILSGLEVCAAIREKDKNSKIILLTARDDKDALLQAIELGLSTYLEKPVRKEQMNQVLLKLSHELQQMDRIFLWQDNKQKFYWDRQKKELFCNSQIFSLPRKQKLLFELLVTTHHEQVSSQLIYNFVWPEDPNVQKYNERLIITLIKNLREKLPPGVIKNAYGLGYYLQK